MDSQLNRLIQGGNVFISPSSMAGILMENNPHNLFDIVVIGGGPAGVTAALRARELGATVALLERDQLGGTCTNDGCVPTRVLARAARLVRDSNQFQAYGLISSPVEVDFKQTLKRAQQVIYQVHEKKQMEYHIENAGVHLVH